MISDRSLFHAEPATNPMNAVSRGAAASPGLKLSRGTGNSKLEVSHLGNNPQGHPMAWKIWKRFAQRPLLRGLPTYRAAVEGGSDVGVVVVGHLLVVGAQEADGLVVAVGGGIVPGYGLVAVVGDVLVGRGAQEPEESHLHHSDGVPIRIHVGELGEVEKGKHWAVRGNATRLGGSKDHQSHPSLSPCSRASCPLLLDLPTPAGHGSCSCHAARHKDALVLLLPGQVIFFAIWDLFMS